MRSWMIGMVAGTVMIGGFAQLPPWHLVPLLLCVSACVLRWSGRPLALLCGFCCGSALGILYGTALLERRLDAACVGPALAVTGEVISLPSLSQLPDDAVRQRFEFFVSEIQPVACSGPQHISLSYYGARKITPGDRWRFAVKLKRPWGLANPGSYNLQAWFAQRGIDATGSVRGEGEMLPATPARWMTVHHRLRQLISARIDALALDADVGAVLKAVTVADKSGMPRGLWQLFQQLGISHLLVISGLHVGLVAGAGFFLARTCSRLLGLGSRPGDWAAGVVALCLSAAYAALAGFSLPTQRALYMLACVVVANALGRGSAAANGLLLAAVLILVANPLAALGSGFWLSFGAVAALLWLSSWRRGHRRVEKMLFTHGFMSLAMLPLGSLFFGGASVVSMFANLIMIPLVGFCVVPPALVAALAGLCHWPVESALWQVAAWPLQQLLPPARWLSEHAGDALYRQFHGSGAVLALAGIAVTLLVVPVGRGVKMLAGVMALPLLLPAGTVPAAHTAALRVSVLDVGQGTAVVIRAGNRALLYDTGGGMPLGSNVANSVILPFLQREGIDYLDTFIISHPDRDHSAGVNDVLAALPVERLRYGQPLQGVRIGRRCMAGESWRWPQGAVFQFLSPGLEVPSSSNNSSCVLQIQSGGYRLLLPGDIDAQRERDLARYWGDSLASDWLLAAHHGSRTSSSTTILKRVRPDSIVISSGYANRFGHPHPLILRRLQEEGDQVFSTAISGAVELELVPGQEPRYSAYRQQKRRYWM